MKREKSLEANPRRFIRTKVLFVCIGNACRSPMAEAIARNDAADVIEPFSVGLAPLGYIADLTRQTLSKNGYSDEGLTSDSITREAVEGADLIINMTGRRLENLLQAGEKLQDWIVEDPFDADPETYQRVFSDIRKRVHQLALELREKRQNMAEAG